jgi:hypothetical protein
MPASFLTWIDDDVGDYDRISNRPVIGIGMKLLDQYILCWHKFLCGVDG